LFNFATESSAVSTVTGIEGLLQSLNTAQGNWTISSIEQPLVQLPEACFVVSEDAGVVNVVQSPETVSPGLGPQHEEKEVRPGAKVETAVQRCRRKKRENESALLVEGLCLDAELTEKMKELWELKGEIKVLSRLTKTGDDITQMVQGWINHAAEAERKSQEEGETVKKTLIGGEKRKALDDLLKKEVPAKKKRKAELDRNVERASKISKEMEQKLRQLLC